MQAEEGASDPLGRVSPFQRTRKLVPNSNEKVRFGERDRPGRSARRPAGRCLYGAFSYDLPAGRLNRCFRPEAENGGRDARAPICRRIEAQWNPGCV